MLNNEMNFWPDYETFFKPVCCHGISRNNNCAISYGFVARWAILLFLHRSSSKLLLTVHVLTCKVQRKLSVMAQGLVLTFAFAFMASAVCLCTWYLILQGLST